MPSSRRKLLMLMTRSHKRSAHTVTHAHANLYNQGYHQNKGTGTHTNIKEETGNGGIIMPGR